MISISVTSRSGIISFDLLNCPCPSQQLEVPTPVTRKQGWRTPGLTQVKGFGDFFLPPQWIPPPSAKHPEEQVPQPAMGTLTLHNHSHQERVRAASLSWKQRLLAGGIQSVWSPGIPLGCFTASTHTHSIAVQGRHPERSSLTPQAVGSH